MPQTMASATKVMSASTRTLAAPAGSLSVPLKKCVTRTSSGDASVENLRIHTIAVDGGTIAKRWMPRSMGRANRINHRTSHLTVVVTDEK